MTKDEKIKKWGETWKTAESNLNAVKRQELQQEDYYLKRRDLLNSMLNYAFEHREIRYTSGLVEMQKWFKKIYEQTISGEK